MTTPAERETLESDCREIWHALVCADSELSAIGHGRPPTSQDELLRIAHKLRAFYEKHRWLKEAAPTRPPSDGLPPHCTCRFDGNHGVDSTGCLIHSRQATIGPQRAAPSSVAKIQAETKQAAAELAAPEPAGRELPDGRRLYLDCDGVLADFDAAFVAKFGHSPRDYESTHGSEVFWRDIAKEAPTFYRDLPLMPDARELFDAVKHLRPIILTGCPKGGWAEMQKLAWAAEHFPGTPMVVCRARDKSLYLQPGDILIDDRTQYRDKWEAAGGVFIHHTSAAESLRLLKACGWRRADAGEGDSYHIAKLTNALTVANETSRRRAAERDELREKLATAQAEIAALRGAWVAGPPPEGNGNGAEYACEFIGRDGDHFTALADRLKDSYCDSAGQQIANWGCARHWSVPIPAYAPPAESEAGRG